MFRKIAIIKNIIISIVRNNLVFFHVYSLICKKINNIVNIVSKLQIIQFNFRNLIIISQK